MASKYHITKDGRKAKKGLYYYMNRAKKRGTSKPGKGSVTDEALERSKKTAKKQRYGGCADCMRSGGLKSPALRMKEGGFKPHMMYDPKTGKGYKANKVEDHERMKKKGYDHRKRKVKKFDKGGAWTRKEGKSPSGGLNEKGRASYNRNNPGSNLQAPQPEGGSRKRSFCARMRGMKRKLTSKKTANDPNSRINKALRKWKC